MTTLSKTELDWIKDALQNDIAKLEQIESEYADNAYMSYCITLRKDNLSSIVAKLTSVINSDSKRIAVK